MGEVLNCETSHPFIAHYDVGNINSLTNTTPVANAGFQYDAFNRLTKATYPEKVYDYAYDPFGNMLTAQENSVTVFSKTYTAANRISGYNYDGRGNLTQDQSFIQVWDKRNRMSESRTAINALLGRYVYNERGLRVKAERYAQAAVQVVAPNGGEDHPPTLVAQVCIFMRERSFLYEDEI